MDDLFQSRTNVSVCYIPHRFRLKFVILYMVRPNGYDTDKFLILIENNRSQS